jgi:hypothetical protein
VLYVVRTTRRLQSSNTIYTTYFTCSIFPLRQITPYTLIIPSWPYSSITANTDVYDTTDWFSWKLTPNYETKFEVVKTSEVSGIHNTIIRAEDQDITTQQMCLLGYVFSPTLARHARQHIQFKADFSILSPIPPSCTNYHQYHRRLTRSVYTTDSSYMYFCVKIMSHNWFRNHNSLPIYKCSSYLRSIRAD